MAQTPSEAASAIPWKPGAASSVYDPASQMRSFPNTFVGHTDHGRLCCLLGNPQCLGLDAGVEDSWSSSIFKPVPVERAGVCSRGEFEVMKILTFAGLPL